MGIARNALRPPHLGRVLTLALFVSACSGPGTASFSSPATPANQPLPVAANATVEAVIDGDTFTARINGQSTRVRLLGVDTPETVDPRRPEQCYGAEASAFLSQLLPAGTPVTLVRDVETTDRYDRLLAYVVRADDGVFVNLALLETGHAETSFYDPNTAFVDEFTAAERQAQADQTGLWGACGGANVPRH